MFTAFPRWMCRPRMKNSATYLVTARCSSSSPRRGHCSRFFAEWRKTFQQLLQYVGASMAFRWPSIWRQLALPHLGFSRSPRAWITNLGLLTGGRRTALPRHQTLRATFGLELRIVARARAPGSATPCRVRQRLYGSSGELGGGGWRDRRIGGGSLPWRTSSRSLS